MRNYEALNWARDLFIDSDIESAKLEAEILLVHVLNTDRLNLYLNVDKSLTEEQIIKYKELVNRRIKHEPLAYIVGHKEFMNLDLIVTEDVLIPRPETEILVETVIDSLRNSQGKVRVADIGTGSGAIILSILQELNNVEAEAVDISEAALDIAKLNAKRYNLLNRITFHNGDLLEPLQGQKFNAIVSNPPYIPSAVIDTLQVEVAKYEPKLALDGGDDGLNFYRRLITGAVNLLTDNGLIAFEIGYNQAESLKKLIKDNGHYDNIEVIKDLSNLDRVVIARNNGN